MLPPQELIDELAGRIETAYSLRKSHWRRGCSTSRIWQVAAVRLWECHANDPSRIPLDAELFVAAQPAEAPLSDPWHEFAHPDASCRFLSVVRQIVRQLRAELKREVALAERTVRRGSRIEAVLGRKTTRISALAAYIVATRAGRQDLADRFASHAAEQHGACPLYRTACLAFIPADHYPDVRLAATVDRPVTKRVPNAELAAHGRYRQCEN